MILQRWLVLLVGVSLALHHLQAFCCIISSKHIAVGYFSKDASALMPNVRGFLCEAKAQMKSQHFPTFGVIFPLDLVRRRMQLEGAGGRARVYKTGLFGTFRHIIRSEGLKGLYRGILPEYYKVVPSVGIVFMTYEIIKQFLSENPTASQ